MGVFADDVVIWTSAKNNAKQQNILEQRMKETLDSLHNWASENNMKINISKTAYQFSQCAIKMTTST